MTDEIEKEEVPDASSGEAAAEETAPVAVRRRSQSPSTPFDYPFVFPALLFALMLWFGWDGWMNPKTKSVMFNRIMFGIFAVCCVWTASVDWRVMKKMKAKKEAESESASETDSQD